MKFKASILAFLLLFSIGFCGCMASTSEPQKTTERHEYEVLSVFQYMYPETNGYGGIYGVKMLYCFTYLDENGNLCGDSCRIQNGEVCIGDENKYVIEKGSTDTYKWLYLTEDTLKNIQINK